MATRTYSQTSHLHLFLASHNSSQPGQLSTFLSLALPLRYQKERCHLVTVWPLAPVLSLAISVTLNFWPSLTCSKKGRSIWGRIQRKTWCIGPYAGVDYKSSPYAHSRFDSNTFTMGNPMPESTLQPYARVDFTTLCKSRLYTRIRDFGFGLWFVSTWCNSLGHYIWYTIEAIILYSVVV